MSFAISRSRDDARTALISLLHPSYFRTGRTGRPFRDLPQIITPIPFGTSSWLVTQAFCTRALLAVLGILLGVVTCPHAAAQSNTKKVLLVFSFSNRNNDADVNRVKSGLQTGFPRPVDFYVEFLEGRRLDDKTYEEGLVGTLTHTYNGAKLDLVVVESYTGLQFLVRHRDELFTGVPIIFMGVDPDRIAGLGMRPGVTGVTVPTDVPDTVDLAFHLCRNTSTAAIITTNSKADEYFLERIRAELLHHKVSEIDLVGLPMSELMERVAALPQQTIVFFQLTRQESLQPAFGVDDLLAWVAQHRPTYSIFPWDVISRGGIGGITFNWDAEISLVAEEARRVLSGEPPENIPVVNYGAHYAVVNWRALQRWHIPESALPPGTVVEFKPASLWKLYKWEIVGIVVSVALLLILIAVLLANLIRRRRAEASLKGMAGQLLHAQDEERRRMARDLHDGTAQDLTGISLCLGEVLEDSLDPKESRHILEQAHELSRKALQEVRSVSYALHPPMLDGTGLVPALRWYFDGLMKRSNLRILLDAPSRIEPMPEIDSTLFRIVQESMSNILRHSGANTARVKLERGSKCVRMSIEDNGHGMGAETVSENGNGASLGVGIAGMRERVRQFGGTFEIRSGSTGTTVLVSVPISEKAYAANHAGG